MDEKQSDGAKDFADQAAAESRPGLVREFWDFLKDSKKWWLTPIVVCLLQVALDAFGTHHSLVERELVPRLHADHQVVLDLELHPALLAAEAAVCLDILVGDETGVEQNG